WIADCSAAEFHLGGTQEPVIVSLLGGTGTGKSTLVNRVLEANLCATSYRRTYTSGAIIVAKRGDGIPPHWLGLSHEAATEPPVRGKSGALTVIELEHPLIAAVTLVDTPDLDGDHPAHPIEADRVFRWSHAVAFVV